MLSVFINEREFFMHPSLSVLEACQYVGVKIPRFCYHERLSVAGNCRMCLVETDKSPKPVASCATPLLAGMAVYTETPMVLKARETVLEALLINHPLDCPICDQGGECDLQDQYFLFGAKASRFYGVKRSVDDISIGPVIKMIMTRCIHCTRCVRFADEICGTPLLGTLHRGGGTEIGNYTSRLFLSDLSGNVVDLCPVGALTAKTTAFRFRPWELSVVESLDLMDGCGGNVYVHYTDFGVVRVLPKKNTKINEGWLSDKMRFGLPGILSGAVNKCGFANLGSFIHEVGAAVVVSPDVETGVLRSLRQISYQSSAPIFVEQFGVKFVGSNVYAPSGRTSFTSSTTASGSNCYFFGADPKTECWVLNTRIRARFRHGVNTMSFGYFYTTTFSVAFIRLHIQEMFDLYRGRSSACSSFRGDYQSIVVLGEALTTRFPGVEAIVASFRGRFPKLLYYYLQLHSNSEGLSYFGIGSYTRRRCALYPCLSVHMSDSILSRKYFSTASVFWCNTFFSEFWTSSNFIFLKSIYETGGLFISLEQRVQLAPKQQLLAWSAAGQSYHAFLVNTFTNYDSTAFFDAAVFQDYARQATGYGLSTQLLPALGAHVPMMLTYSSYPLKPILSSSYTSTPTGQNSVLLTFAQQEKQFFDSLF